MSSPFQQKFSLKNPFGKNPKLSSVDTESDLPEAQFAGDDIESYDPKGAVVAERLKENYPESVDNKKKTQVKSDSPLPMYAYVSTAPHFQRLQDNIAAAFTPKKKTGPTSEDKKNQAMEDYYKSLTKTSEKPETETSYDKAIESGVTKEQMDKVFNAGSTIFKNN